MSTFAAWMRMDVRSLKIDNKMEQSVPSKTNIANEMDSGAPIEMEAVGRPFSLGMLYDCRIDKLIPGLSLWNKEALQKDLMVVTRDNTECDIQSNTNISDKLSSLNIKGSLRLSILSGTVDLGGSGCYLKEEKTSTKQVSVSLNFSKKTRFEQLSMNHLGTANVTYQDIFENQTATHVVTGILYGFKTIFSFTRDVSKTENTSNVEGNILSMVKNIPTFIANIKGAAEMKNNEEEKKEADKFNCKYYGDIALESNPTSYEEVIKIYQYLPRMLNDHLDKAVPIRVWLHPLNKLDSRAAKLVREISESLIIKAENVILQMSDINIQCNDLLKHPTAVAFPQIKKKIMQFREICMQRKHLFQKQLATALMSIRSGDLQETGLMDILISIEESPFGYFYIADFMNRRQHESDIINSLIRTMSHIKIVTTESDLFYIIHDPKIKHVISYNFTSLDEDATYISNLRSWIQNYHEKSARGIYTEDCKTPWFQDNYIIRKTRMYMDAFQQFSDINGNSKDTDFIISCIPDKKHPGATIYLYSDGILESTMFEPPSKPNLPSISKTLHDSIELILHPADFGNKFIKSYQIEYKTTLESSWVTFQTNVTNQKITITQLESNVSYQIRYSGVCKPGLGGPTSDITKPVKTLPAGPPENLSITVEPTSIIARWKAPTVVAEGVLITEYKIRLKKDNGSTNKAEKSLELGTVTKTEGFVLDGLQPMTLYKIRVCATCGQAGDGALTEETAAFTTSKESWNIAHKLLNESTLLVTGQPSIYQLKTDIETSENITYNLGSENENKTNKMILLLGDTESGKDSLIHLVANYVVGVEWKYDFRFKLPQNKTDKLQIYHLNYEVGFKVPYSLTIVDAPGFESTASSEQGKDIVKAVHAFLTCNTVIPQIDAMCFVVQAPRIHLSDVQKYIFDSVSSYFGKDTKRDIIFLINFCDGERPRVLDALKNLDAQPQLDNNGEPVHFKFNHSALFANNFLNKESACKDFSEMFWNVGTESVKAFLETIQTMKTNQLKLTRGDLGAEKQIEVNLHEIQHKLKAELDKLERLRKIQGFVEQNKSLTQTNVTCNIDMHVPKKKTITSKFVTNCQQCYFTCHDDCHFSDDSDKWRCTVMDGNRYCEVCPGKCYWKKHYNHNYVWEYEVQKNKLNLQSLVEKYKTHSKGEMDPEGILEEIASEYSRKINKILHLIEQSSSDLTQLHDYSLQPVFLSITERIDLMIQAEQQEAKPGYEERIKSLAEVKALAELPQTR